MVVTKGERVRTSRRRPRRATGVLSSRRVLIAGCYPLAATLRRALVWTSRQRLTISEIDAWMPDGLSRTILANSADAPETIIILAADRTTPAEVVRIVQYLRAKLQWYGQFVAVLPTKLECRRVLETNLFGLADPSLAFSQVSGHRALALPLMLPELLGIVEAPEPMDASRWAGLAHAGATLPTFRDEIAKAQQLARNGSSGPAIGAALQHLLSRLADFQWSALLDHHEDERMVRTLCERHENGAVRDREEALKLIEQLQYIVSRTFAGLTI